MSATDLVLRLISLFEKLSIPYMLVGSYSSNYYGRPRSTQDADFVVILGSEQSAFLRQSLKPEFDVEEQLSFESITMTTRHVITHRATAFKIEIFLLSEEPYDQSRFARRRQVEFEGQTAWLPTAEDVIVQKLRWFRRGKRAKDISDASEVIRLQRRHLDLAYIRRWTVSHQSLELFEELLTRFAGQG